MARRYWCRSHNIVKSSKIKLNIENTFKLKISFIILQNSDTPSIEQVINQMRDDMIRTQSNSNTTAILSFDKLVGQLKVFASQISEKNSEILRLEQLCTKNNVECSPKNETSQKIPSTLKTK